MNILREVKMTSPKFSGIDFLGLLFAYLTYVGNKHRLPRRAPLVRVGVNWSHGSGGQSKTWDQFTISSAAGPNCAGRCRLSGWGLRDNRDHRPEALADSLESVIMAQVSSLSFSRS